MNTWCLYIIALFGAVNHADAQDIHFSQFTENPSLLNPALAGAHGPLRTSINYRDQWGSVNSPYKSFGLNFETRISQGNWQQIDRFRTMTFRERTAGRFGAGFSVYNDKAGAGSLGLTQGNLVVSTFIPVSGKSFLSAGIQAGIAQRKLDPSKLIFPDQFNGTVYDPEKFSNEKLGGGNFTYFDFATGLLWMFSDEEKKITGHKYRSLKIGASVFHLNQPDQNFLNALGILPMRYVLHTEGLFSFPARNIAIAPAGFAQLQGKNMEFTGGFTIKYFLNNDSKYTGYVKSNSIGYGMYYRSGDALITSLLLELREQYAFIMSYDFNISRLTVASSARGGFELTLRFTPPKAFLYQMKTLPEARPQH